MARNDGEFVSSQIAARLLGVSQSTLARHETPDGTKCHILGGTLRVWRTSAEGIRLYSRTEIKRLIRRP